MVQSVRGQAGGYTLARPADQITVSQVLNLLGGNFFGSHFCERHAGLEKECTHTTDCSLRQLWGTMQQLLDGVLSKTTLRDLLQTEREMATFLDGRKRLVFEIGQNGPPLTLDEPVHAGVS